MNRISSVESPARKRRAPKRRDGSAQAAKAETSVLRKADLLSVTGHKCKVDLAVLWRNPHPSATGRLNRTSPPASLVRDLSDPIHA